MKHKAPDALDKDQINLFDIIDAPKKKREEEEYFNKRTVKYHKWLSLPDVTIIKEDSEERNQTASMVWEGGYDLYHDAEHRCEQMPANVKIWQNPCNVEYWVLNKDHNPSGEKCDACPYCKAELSKGKGDVILTKADAWRWNSYLYYMTPMHERGFVTLEERRMSQDRGTVKKAKKTPDIER